MAGIKTHFTSNTFFPKVLPFAS